MGSGRGWGCGGLTGIYSYTYIDTNRHVDRLNYSYIYIYRYIHTHIVYMHAYVHT